MKKAIVLSVLGIAASALAALGQGTINFNNYAANYQTDQVLWGANTLGFTSGSAVTPTQGVTVQLLYASGDLSGDTTAAFLTAATAGLSGGITSGANATGAYGVGPYGYYVLGAQILTGWTSGTPDTFAVEAWVGASYATATTRGVSALFTATDAVGNGPGIVASSLPPHNFATMPSVTLSSVPEPTTLAFAGMGMLSLLALARRKNV